MNARETEDEKKGKLASLDKKQVFPIQKIEKNRVLMGSKITKLKAKKKSRSQPGSNAAVDNQAQGGEAAAAPVATSVPAPVATEEEVAAPAATTPSSIQLFTRGICPFSEQVRIALTHKQLPFVFDDISGKPVPEWWSQATSDDTVPVLLVIQPSSTSTLTSTSTYMNDSDEMLEWIDKQQPPQQALRIPASYAVSAEDTEKWVKLIRSEWIPSQMKLTMSPNPQIQQEFRPKLKAAFEAVVVHLKVGGWVGGENNSI